MYSVIRFKSGKASEDELESIGNLLNVRVPGTFKRLDRAGGRFSLTLSQAFQASMDKSEVVWAPDGDEAFDDGSFVLQFDEKDTVRVLAFRRGKGDSDISDLADVRLDPDEFYGVLGSWHSQFEIERTKALP